jgi:outer membrane receptor protein involved in Fe transport
MEAGCRRADPGGMDVHGDRRRGAGRCAHWQNAVNNVGALRTRGVELELTAKPFNALLLESSLAYVDARITSYEGAGCYLGQTLALDCTPLGSGFVQDLSGERLRWFWLDGLQRNPGTK